jgi:CRP-like cAMP-binding protein
MHGPDFLQFLASAEGAGLAGAFQDRSYRRHQAVYRPGDGLNVVLVVRSGRLRVHLADEVRELTLLYLEAGDVFATHGPAHITAVAPSQLALMPTAQFRGHLAGPSPAVVAIMRVLGRLLARTVEVVEGLVFHEAHERLARLLVALVRRQGRLDAAGVWQVPLPFTLTDVAMMLGASRQTVSAAFADLERRGVLRKQGRRQLQVFDLHQLERQGRCEASASRQTAPTHPT